MQMVHFIFFTKNATMRFECRMGISLLRREGGRVRNEKEKNDCTKNITMGLEYQEVTRLKIMVFMYNGIYSKTQVSNSLVSGRNDMKRKEEIRYMWIGHIKSLLKDFSFSLLFFLFYIYAV